MPNPEITTHEAQEALWNLVYEKVRYEVLLPSDAVVQLWFNSELFARQVFSTEQ